MRHLIVVGSGVAGLTAALEAASRPHVRVTLLTKADLGTSNTRWAQGGVAVVTDPADSVASHVADTLAAGAGLSDAAAAEVLCSEGPDAVARLMRLGVRFDVHDGELARGLEAAHAHARVLHAGGDATGAAISDTLVARVRASAVEVRERTTVVDLVVDGPAGGVVGVRLLDGTVLRADAVVLATGGAGQLYPYTTNPAVATGDGLAAALRAGAVAADLELYQFHPTALAVPGSPLVSEAVRGEGAVLRAADGHRFMPAVHPDAELAPRDVVARGIAEQMACQGGAPVLLDATALGAAFLARRFPTIDASVRAHGLDWGAEPVPVAPAAHYFMGGVRTDLEGRTSLPGLLAVGEVACNGLHGANRLASNSLLEGAVYGLRVVEAALDEPRAAIGFGPGWAEPLVLARPSSPTVPAPTRHDLQRLLWDVAGLTRDAEGLERGLEVLDQVDPAVPEGADVKQAEDANLRVVARALVASALGRRESLGGHHRTDAPTDVPGTPSGPARHSAVRLAPSAGGPGEASC